MFKTCNKRKIARVLLNVFFEGNSHAREINNTCKNPGTILLRVLVEMFVAISYLILRVQMRNKSDVFEKPETEKA